MPNSTSKVLQRMEFTYEELQNIKKTLDESSILAVTDRTGKITFVNDRFCEISKYTREELIGQDHRILNSSHHNKQFFKNLWKTIGVGETWKGEICNRAKDGSLYWVQTTIVPFLDEKGKPYQYISIRNDITAQKNIKKITHYAYHDDLTGLPNRRFLYKQLQTIIDDQTTQANFSLLSIDINRFKNINDGLGHEAGDVFLKQLAERFKRISKEVGQIYRLNGDEFIFVVSQNGEQAEHLSEVVLDCLRESFTIRDYEFFATASVGISEYPKDGQSIKELLKAADYALYHAKKHKGNFAVRYTQSLNVRNDELLMLETSMHHALRNEEFELHYQPKVHAKSLDVVGMEALIRWNHPERGLLSPVRFIPIAEDCGLIAPIGEWVLYTASKHVKAWNEKFGTALRVSVNISPKHLMERSFISVVKRIIAQTGVNPKHLDIEITEMTMVDQNDILVDKIHQLNEIGITVSVDDFGTGYSSLSYLKSFPVNTLKIDRSFVSMITKEQSGIPMVSAIIKLAHALQLEVVAEGVEIEEELEVLRCYECEWIQGYYSSRPLNYYDFTTYMERHLKTRHI